MNKFLLVCGLCISLFLAGCSGRPSYVPIYLGETNNITTENNITIYVNTTNNITNSYSTFHLITCQRNGTYCDGSVGSTARTIATAYTNTVLRCFPYVVGKSYKIDQLGVIVGTANASHNLSIKVALYSDNGYGYPNALLTNTSNIIPSATGFRGQTITPYTLNNNSLYWLCSAGNGTTTTARVNVIPISDYPNVLGSGSSGVAQNIGYTVDYTYTNALPNPYTAGATYVTAIYPSAYARVRTD